MRNITGIVLLETFAQIARHFDIVPFWIVSAAENVDIVHVVFPRHTARLRPLGFGAAAVACFAAGIGDWLAEP